MASPSDSRFESSAALECHVGMLRDDAAQASAQPQELLGSRRVFARTLVVVSIAELYDRHCPLSSIGPPHTAVALFTLLVCEGQACTPAIAMMTLSVSSIRASQCKSARGQRAQCQARKKKSSAGSSQSTRACASPQTMWQPRTQVSLLFACGLIGLPLVRICRGCSRARDPNGSGLLRHERTFRRLDLLADVCCSCQLCSWACYRQCLKLECLHVWHSCKGPCHRMRCVASARRVRDARTEQACANMCPASAHVKAGSPNMCTATAQRVLYRC